MWPYTLCFPPGLLAAGPMGAAQEEHLLLRLLPPTLSTPLAALTLAEVQVLYWKLGGKQIN